MNVPTQLTLLGIAGNARSGKDTLADFLAAELGFSITHFADAFKNILKDIFEFSDDQLWGKSKDVPDQRYAFSGICPLDHAQCSLSDTDRLWCCPVCKNTYEKFLAPRFTMMTLGTEWGRTMYADVWTDMTLRKIQQAFQTENKQRWIVADLRMRNEVERIHAAGGKAILIKRSIIEEHLWHATESELTAMPDSQFDAVIDNNGTLDELKAKAHELGKTLYIT